MAALLPYRKWPVVSAGLLVLACAGSATASVMIHGHVHGAFFDNVESEFDDQSISGSPLSNSLSKSYQLGSMSASVVAAQGYLRMSVTVSMDYPSDQSGGAFAGAEASGGFSDTVVISAPGLSGTPDTFTPHVYVAIDGFTSLHEGAGADLDYTVGDQHGHVGVAGGDGTFSPVGVIPVAISPVSFTYDQPFNLLVEASVHADAGAETDGLRRVPNGSAGASFPASFHWLGIEGLPGDAFISQGAIDWIQPVAGVPEPSSLSLLALAGALQLRARTRRR
jgi:hypothetical protein